MNKTSTRPTQLQRSEAMKGRLLEATLELISEEGWAQVSTQKICARAEVSRGAQTHHFPSKESLLIAAVEELVGRYQKRMDAEFSTTEDRARSLEELFDFLYDACFEGPLLECWMDAMVAARTDEALRERVEIADARALRVMRERGETCSTQGLRSSSDVSDIVELTVYLLRGMVIQHGVHMDEKRRRALFSLWKSVVLR